MTEKYVPSRAAWLASARPTQLPPEGDWKDWMLWGDRGWGKTRAAMEQVMQWVRTREKGDIAVLAPDRFWLTDMLLEGVTGFRMLSEIPFAVVHGNGVIRLQFDNGALVVMSSPGNHRVLEGYRFGAAFIESPERFQTYDWIQAERALALAMRFEAAPQRVFTFANPPPWRAGRFAGEGVRLTIGGSPAENASNLPAGFIDQLDRTEPG